MWLLPSGERLGVRVCFKLARWKEAACYEMTISVFCRQPGKIVWMALERMPQGMFMN